MLENGSPWLVRMWLPHIRRTNSLDLKTFVSRRRSSTCVNRGQLDEISLNLKLVLSSIDQSEARSWEWRASVVNLYLILDCHILASSRAMGDWYLLDYGYMVDMKIARHNLLNWQQFLLLSPILVHLVFGRSTIARILPTNLRQLEINTCSADFPRLRMVYYISSVAELSSSSDLSQIKKVQIEWNSSMIESLVKKISYPNQSVR